ncbi:MAG: hypothetical protein U0667_04145 [Chloroflexota bacterium]
MALTVTILGQLVLGLPFGRRLYAIGSNPDAARVAGLPIRDVPRVRGLWRHGWPGRVPRLGKFGNITVVAGQLELQVIAAAVVGGVAISGGSGTAIGALLGALLIATLRGSLLRWLGISQFALDAVLGALILFAVTADAVILRRLNELWVQVRRRDAAAAAGQPDGGVGAATDA